MASSTKIRLIAGLGNPGGQYEQTRHNAGFWFVDQLARRAGATLRHENKFHGDVAKARFGEHEVFLLKPDTFMNLSGQAVSALARFYKIPLTEILVVHDEIDLPPGTARLKKGGGHGGNNGLRDIIAKLGKDFIRLRLGVGRPSHSSEVTNYVLRRPTADEQISIERAMDDGESIIPLLLGDGLEKAMHRLHSRRDEPSVKKSRKPGGDGAATRSAKSAPESTRTKTADKVGSAGGTSAANARPAAGPNASVDGPAKPTQETSTKAAETPVKKVTDSGVDSHAQSVKKLAPGTAEKKTDADDHDTERAPSLRDQLAGLFRRNH